MKKYLNLFMIPLCLCISISFAACGDDDDDEPTQQADSDKVSLIVGTWKHLSQSENDNTLVTTIRRFNADGTGYSEKDGEREYDYDYEYDEQNKNLTLYRHGKSDKTYEVLRLSETIMKLQPYEKNGSQIYRDSIRNYIRISK